MNFVFIPTLVLLLHLPLTSCTIGPKTKPSLKDKKLSSQNAQKNNRRTDDDKLTPQELRLENMISQNLTGVTDFERKFPNCVLGYVTPWNNKGYNFAKNLGAKFDLISPVWYQLKRLNGKVEFGGLQDTDSGWMNDVRSSNPAVKILPRLLFDGWTQADLSALFSSEMSQAAVVDKIAKFAHKNSFDGIVCEILLQVGYQFKEQAMHFLSMLGEVFKSNKLLTIVPLPPPLLADGNPNGFFTPQDYSKLKSAISFFNVMAYDFPNGRNAGPVAPASWVAGCILYYTKSLPLEEQNKFLMGLNFYGYQYRPQTNQVEPIVGSQYLDLIKRHVSTAKLQWDNDAAEHVLEIPGSHVVFYPTLHSMKLRLQLAERLNVGVGIWDLGQGLDHFYNLF